MRHRRSQADRLRDHRRRRGGAEGLAAPAAGDLGDARRRAAEAVLRRACSTPRRRSRPARDARAPRSAVAEQLRAMEPEAIEKDDPFPLMVLRGGIEFNEWFADWCERMEASCSTPLAEKGATDVRRPRPPRRRPRPPDRPDRDRLLPPRRRRSAARSPTGSTPTAPTTRRPRRSRRENQLKDAGLRVPGVIVVLEHAPVSSPATRARVARLERELRPPRRRPVGQQLLQHPLHRLRLQRPPLDLLRGRAEADRRQGVAGKRRRDRRTARGPARGSSSAAPRSPRSRSTSRSRRTCGWRRCSPSRCSSCSPSSSSAASSRRCCR